MHFKYVKLRVHKKKDSFDVNLARDNASKFNTCDPLMLEMLDDKEMSAGAAYTHVY